MKDKNEITQNDQEMKENPFSEKLKLKMKN